NVNCLPPHHLHWPDLVVDLAVKSIRHHDKSPLVARPRFRAPGHSRSSSNAAILARIDHVTIGVADLASGIAAYRRLGFDVDDVGIARNDGDRLQLAPAPREGLRSIALASDDLAADSAAVHARHGIAYLTLVAPNVQ